MLSYCTCKIGARTLGGCAHSTAILYHLTVGSIDSVKLPKIQANSKLRDIIDVREFKLAAKRKRDEECESEKSEDSE